MHFRLKSKTALSPSSLKAFSASNKAPTKGKVTTYLASLVNILYLAHNAFNTTIESPLERVYSNA